MYICQSCKQTVPTKIKAHRIVVKSRLRWYPFREKAIPIRREGKVKRIHDFGGRGREIMKEMTVCPGCALERSRG